MPRRLRTRRQRIVSLCAIALGLLGTLGTIHLLGHTPPLPLMTLVVTAAAWFGGVRNGYVAFGAITLAALIFDHALISGVGLDDFVVFAVLSMVLIHAISLVDRARQAEDLARDALRQRQMSMRATIDGIPAFIAYIDRDMRYVMHNRMYEEWFPRNDIDGADVRRIVGDAAYGDMQPLLARALAGESVNGTQSIEHHGVQHQFDVHYRPHRNDAGGVLGVAVMIHDITERQATIEMSRASEARLRSLAMASAAIVWIADRDGAIIEAQGWHAFTGQRPDEHLGDGWLAAVHADDRVRIGQAWQEARAMGKAINTTYRLRTASGGHRMVIGQGIPIRDDGGHVTEWIGTVRDIEDQYRLERDLREREHERDALLENVPHMVWIADADGDILFSNRRWYEYTALKPGDHWKCATHPDDIERAENLWRHSLSTGEPLVVEKRFLRAIDGEYRWHLVQGVPIRDADDRIDRWYGSSVDIEDQKRALTTLAEANQRISRFLSILSHELRNPISGIITASELLANVTDDATVRARVSGMIARQSRQLHRTIDDLLDISRVTEGRIELITGPCDLHRVIRELLIDLELDAARNGIELRLASPPREAIRVDADEIRLRQIFTNLITNAIKASRRGQCIEIDIEVASTGRHCRVVVSDQGVGLSNDIRDTLFEPFVQAEDWRRRGRGLGLAIARQLAELHGGMLYAEDSVVGRGARFVLELPLSTATLPESTDAGSAPAVAATARTLRILIVDDELANAEALQFLLEAQGHAVEVASDAEMAMSAWRGQQHEVVLCDIDLPGPLDGHDVARALRMQEPRPYLIAYSGYGQPQHLADSREAGFDEHLVKPATLSQVLDALQRAP